VPEELRQLVADSARLAWSKDTGRFAWADGYLRLRDSAAGTQRDSLEQLISTQQAEDETAARRRQAFNDQLLEWVKISGEVGVQDYVKWYMQGSPGLGSGVADVLSGPDAGRLALDTIAIQVESGPFLHSMPSAQAFWIGQLSPDGEARVDRCMLCGTTGPVVDKLPQAIAGANVPGTTASQVALISANFSSALRGATGGGLKSSPICPSCGIRAVQSFNGLASDRRHRLGLFGDTATVWWVKGVSDNEGVFSLLEDPDPGRVKRLLESPLDPSSRPRGPVDGDRFFALTYSGNVARLVVRSWVDVPLSDAERNIQAWFADIATPAEREFPSLGALAKSAGDLARVERKWRETIPDGTVEALLRTALVGASPPRGLLLRALGRARAEVHVESRNDGLAKSIARQRASARFGLFRLILNRTYLKENPMKQHLDEGRRSPAYLSGRLFAVRESLQYAASGDVNASIVDRFFSRASENPASVEHSLAALEKQHLKAVERKRGKGVATALDKRITELHDLLGADGAPGRLSDTGSAEWIAGYYQQRQHDFSAAAERKAAQAHSNNETQE
jgi:CRISPR-associated protein Csd1